MLQKYILFLVLSLVGINASYWVRDAALGEDIIGRVLHTAVTHYNHLSQENYVVIFGGLDHITDTATQTSSAGGGDRLNDAYKYSIQSGTWTMINPKIDELADAKANNVPTTRALHSATVVPHDAPSFQNCMFSYGGDIDFINNAPRMVALNLSSDSWIIDWDKNSTWFYDPEFNVEGRRNPVFEYSKLDHSLILYAGGSKNGLSLGQMHKFFLENETWTQIAYKEDQPFPQNRARPTSSISSDGRFLYIYGGNPYSGIPTPYSPSFSDFWRFDLLLHSWKLLSSDLGRLSLPAETSQLFMVNEYTFWLLPYDVPGYSELFPLTSRKFGKWHAYQYRLDLNEWRDDPIRSSESADPLWALWHTACLFTNQTSNISQLAITSGNWFNDTYYNFSIPMNNIRILAFEEAPPFIPITDDSSQKPSSKDDNHTTVIVVAIVVPIGILLIAAIVFVMFLKRRRSNRAMMLDGFSEGGNYPMTNVLSDCVIHDVIISNRLGGGNFSEVYKGSWQGSAVACKKLKASEHFKSFEQEAKILRSLKHPNVVQFFGIYYGQDGSQYIVTEFMQNGSLLQLFQVEKSLTMKDLLRLCVDTAAGMMFISESNHLVHRDLAIRNLLVTNKEGRYVAKIADLGLARNISDEGHYLSNDSSFPVKWTAPEAIQYRKFTDKSDVWSFGITMFEILSYGQEPYAGMSNDMVAEQVLKGHRLSRPSENTPDAIYDLMKECWNSDPEMRPSFKTMHQKISNIINNS